MQHFLLLAYIDCPFDTVTGNGEQGGNATWNVKHICAQLVYTSKGHLCLEATLTAKSIMM